MGKNFSANNLGQRKKADFYETPYSLTRQLLKHENLVGSILEPACGDGAIVKILKEWFPTESYGYFVDWYDLPTDFLKDTHIWDTIITNPPFSLAKEFILKAKTLAARKIIFLLPLSYLHGKARYDLIWCDKEFPLARVWVFTRYPMLGDKLREDGKYRTGMMVYAWFVWDKKHKGHPEIRWIDNNEYVLGKKDQ